ncbi:MAG: ATP-dependent 6-phosphofructokinase [Tenuifilaceae bacterium]|jgi:6-phosphofructokinase 1|nr:ATP-dependent 6-phosphofructokinase [Bacteroidales bacterium]MDI9515752.1 ATP-dependent 6-phosphofructokinase [Bacteroidota bacterium]OQC64108.1 MAG: 6-phosphofructokinase 1 [Bacteroidetes bacterium ADurb.Bin008]HNV81415.1 ATP-dependent 6-phosphofructokinase [Tenuifilaceae bacterium]HOF91619.1 ATP-dependent 6-phosphofructokinase [Tenuifilaceae bacterium]
MKRVLVATGGGDCPGLNAVIRAIVKRAQQEPDWEVIGSIESFNGILREPTEIRVLDERAVAGIHVQGGTIIGSTNKGGPFAWPIKNKDGSWDFVDRSDEMIRKLQYLGVDAVISIGGDGSQKISQALFEKGLNIIGVPKTIDNDLSATDFTFGFQTAVQIATEAVDKLVTTAASHNRVLVLEVMGRFAGWIALHAAIGGGAEVCLIPEIPYDLNKVLERLKARYSKGKGNAIVVIAEGAKPKDGSIVFAESKEVGYSNLRLGGVAHKLTEELKMAGFEADMRETVLGHLQRGGIPTAYDRILATQFGVKAFEMVLEQRFGQMVAYRHPNIVAVPLSEAVGQPNFVDPGCDLVKTAKGIGISFGD